MRWCKSLTKDITRWLMTKNRVALSISLSLSLDWLTQASRVWYFIFSDLAKLVFSGVFHPTPGLAWRQSYSSGLGWCQRQLPGLSWLDVEIGHPSEAQKEVKPPSSHAFVRFLADNRHCHCFPASKTRESSPPFPPNMTYSSGRATSNCCPVRTTFFYILLWNTPGKDSKFRLKTRLGGGSRLMNSHRWLFRRDKHSDKVWSLGADIGQIRLKVLCWGFVQLSVSPLHSGREDQRATESSHKPPLHFWRWCFLPRRSFSVSTVTWSVRAVRITLRSDLAPAAGSVSSPHSSPETSRWRDWSGVRSRTQSERVFCQAHLEG